MPRLEFTKTTKLLAFARANGHCEGCGAKLKYGCVEYDHIQPCEFGGDNSLENLHVLCKTCHRLKTSHRDIPAIAKSNRLRARRANILPRKRSWGYGAKDPWKKKLDGRVVKR